MLDISFPRMLKKEKVNPGNEFSGGSMELWSDDFEGRGDFGQYRSKLRGSKWAGQVGWVAVKTGVPMSTIIEKRMENQYSILVTFDDQNSTDEFHKHFNGRRFSSLEIESCCELFTVFVQYTRLIEHTQTSLANTEQPSCPVCLETGSRYEWNFDNHVQLLVPLLMCMSFPTLHGFKQRENLVVLGIALTGFFIIDKEGVIQYSIVNNLAIGGSVDESLRTLQFSKLQTLPSPAKKLAADLNHKIIASSLSSIPDPFRQPLDNKVANRKNDVQSADFVESEFLREQVAAIKKISGYVAQLRRVGKGHMSRIIAINRKRLYGLIKQFGLPGPIYIADESVKMSQVEKKKLRVKGGVANLKDILAERGACEVGFIAKLDNKGSHQIVQAALTALA
ncbi:hypothetical protein M8C21_025412 [Ambrosia artemisiifolia]|uniref:BRCA1-associated 2/ETP1 RRM domain-containing protein n=1 Tax=Ambrosia artemisiifolia TaxID=4212 RepID=A0AAD5C3W1_AMBAR|nr:hypothetical protein M8C21_025412 [Ambrosia artemisiifolia]